MPVGKAEHVAAYCANGRPKSKPWFVGLFRLRPPTSAAFQAPICRMRATNRSRVSIAHLYKCAVRWFVTRGWVDRFPSGETPVRTALSMAAPHTHAQPHHSTPCKVWNGVPSRPDCPCSGQAIIPDFAKSGMVRPALFQALENGNRSFFQALGKVRVTFSNAPENRSWKLIFGFGEGV